MISTDDDMDNAKFAYYSRRATFQVITGIGAGITETSQPDEQSSDPPLHDSEIDLKNPRISYLHIPTDVPSFDRFSTSSPLSFARSVGGSEAYLYTDESSVPSSMQLKASNEDATADETEAAVSTWAALISRPWLSLSSTEEATEGLLLKTPEFKTELDAVFALHDLIKAEVSKRISTFDDPSKFHDAAVASASLLAKIPSGWALGLDEQTGMVYFVDHNSKITQWQMPGYKDVKAIKQVISRQQACEDAAAALQSLLPALQKPSAATEAEEDEQEALCHKNGHRD